MMPSTDSNEVSHIARYRPWPLRSRTIRFWGGVGGAAVGGIDGYHTSARNPQLAQSIDRRVAPPARHSPMFSFSSATHKCARTRPHRRSVFDLGRVLANRRGNNQIRSGLDRCATQEPHDGRLSSVVKADAQQALLIFAAARYSATHCQVQTRRSAEGVIFFFFLFLPRPPAMAATAFSSSSSTRQGLQQKLAILISHATQFWGLWSGKPEMIAARIRFPDFPRFAAPTQPII